MVIKCVIVSYKKLVFIPYIYIAFNTVGDSHYLCTKKTYMLINLKNDKVFTKEHYSLISHFFLSNEDEMHVYIYTDLTSYSFVRVERH